MHDVHKAASCCTVVLRHNFYAMAFNLRVIAFQGNSDVHIAARHHHTAHALTSVSALSSCLSWDDLLQAQFAA